MKDLEVRRLSLRVEPDGGHGVPDGPPDPSWLSAGTGPQSAVLWLERPGPAGPVEAMVLERAAAAARAVLARTRGRAPSGPGEDEAAIEVLIDASAPPGARQHAARALGLTGERRVRAVALAARDRIEPAIRTDSPASTDCVASTDPLAGVDFAVSSGRRRPGPASCA